MKIPHTGLCLVGQLLFLHDPLSKDIKVDFPFLVSLGFSE
jgi:hypothetical protein